MARNTHLCFKTTCVSMFLHLRSIVCYFQCFVRGSSPFGKVVSHETPLPLGNYRSWTPPPPWNFQWSSVGGGGAVWMFSGTTQCMKLKYLMQYSASVNSVHNLLAKSMMQKLHGLTYLVLLNKNNWHWKGGKRNKWFKNNWNNIKTAASGGKWFRNRKCLKNTVMSKISVSLKSKQN